MKNCIYSIYFDLGRADHVVERLLDAGIGKEAISILTNAVGAARLLALTYGKSPAQRTTSEETSVGAALSLISESLVEAASASPAVRAAGPRFAGLASAGAPVGSLAEALRKIGIPERRARSYAQQVAQRDALLIGVDVADQDRPMVRQIMLEDKRNLGVLARA